MPRSIKEILEEGLDNARKKGLFEGPTNVNEARFLGLSPALLSRIKANKATLTDEKIKKIAKKLTDNDEAREKFERELFFSRDGESPTSSPSISRASRLISSVEDLFRRISNPDSL